MESLAYYTTLTLILLLIRFSHLTDNHQYCTSWCLTLLDFLEGDFVISSPLEFESPLLTESDTVVLHNGAWGCHPKSLGSLYNLCGYRALWKVNSKESRLPWWVDQAHGDRPCKPS